MEKVKLLIILICVSAASCKGFKSLVIQSPDVNAECTKGETFWCQHIMNAKKCNAVNHCIQAVWQTHSMRNDSNPICDDCKDWVKKARDFIAQKKTSDQIIKTLGISCNLCPVQKAREHCHQIVEENVHEILKLLEANLDPNAVCSAIHFCNNDELTEIFNNQPNHPHKVDQAKQYMLPFTCGQCNQIGYVMEKKFKDSDHDDVLESLLKICGEMSSFSDSCSNIVIKNFNEIRPQLDRLISRKEICHFSCRGQHSYQENIVDIEPVFDNANVPCQMCEQLMLHLRELLITNTTEMEFKNVLEGFCTQMPKITDECISIVDEYYSAIYHYLETNLDAKKSCVMIGICSVKENEKLFAPSMPLLSSELFSPPQQNVEVHQVAVKSSSNSIKLVKGGKLCTACEYAVELVHVEIGKHTVQDKILEKAIEGCKKLPVYVKQCEDIFNAFGSEMMTAIYEGTNPRLVCPDLNLCPPNFDLEDMEKTAVDDKPTCPFCLLAMQQLKEFVQSNKTKENIEGALEKLCKNLSSKLKAQCEDFVDKYSPQVVDMMLANFTPQEACVFLKLCSTDKPTLKRVSIVGISSESFSDSDSSEDFLDDDETKSSSILNNPQCDLCKTVVKLIEERVINIKSKDEIRRVLEESCDRLKKFNKECKAFVDKYSDRIVDLVSRELEPDRICKDLIFCVAENQRETQDYDMGLDFLVMAFDDKHSDEVIGDTGSTELDQELSSSPGCVICEFVLQKIQDDLNDKNTDEEIKKTVKNVCSKMPQTVSKQCHQFVDYYFDMIIALIEASPPSEWCSELKLCPKTVSELETKLEAIKADIYTCAVCKGVVEGFDTIIEDPKVEVKLEDLAEKTCEKFAGKFKQKCHNLASTYGVAIINLLRNLTESDQICFKLELCEMSEMSGMLRLS